jgi:hypothetical protein
VKSLLLLVVFACDIYSVSAIGGLITHRDNNGFIQERAKVEQQIPFMKTVGAGKVHPRSESRTTVTAYRTSRSQTYRIEYSLMSRASLLNIHMQRYTE